MPGGIYNYGSSNSLNSYDLNLLAASLMRLEAHSTVVQPDEERFSEQTRNLAMDCSAIAEYDIHFHDSIEGIEKALRKAIRNEVV